MTLYLIRKKGNLFSLWILPGIKGLKFETILKENYFILLAGKASKTKCVLGNWKSDHCISYNTPEKTLYSVRRDLAAYEKVRGSLHYYCYSTPLSC